MARGHGIIIEVAIDATQMARQLTRAKHSTKEFERDFSHAMRGVVAGSGAFNHLGRSIAFASGGFLAFSGVSEFLRKSVDAAREAVVAQRSLAAQMKASGESFAANRDRVEEVTRSYGRFGFQNDEVVASLTVLERATGHINKAISLQGLTANLARAKNIDLAAAANTVGKVFGGQETALRRAVPGLAKNAHGMDLIRLAQAKLAGQAAANTTAQERFGAVLHDTEEIVGAALLPTLNNLLNSTSAYLIKLQQSGELQRDVEKASRFMTDGLNAARSVISPLVTAFKDLAKVMGSNEGALKALATAFVGFKVARFAGSLTETATSLGLIGTKAKGSAKEVGTLNTRLGRTAGIGVITVTIALEILQSKQYKDAHSKGRGALDSVGLGFLGGAIDSLPKVLSDEWARAQKIYNYYADKFRHHPVGDEAQALVKMRAAKGMENAIRAQLKAQDAATGDGDTTKKLDPKEAARRAALRRQWFDAMLGRREDQVQDIASLQGQLAEWRSIAALLEERIKVTKDATRRFNLEGELLNVNRQEKAVLAQMQENSKTLAAQRKEAEKQAAERRATARNARQYRALGFTGTGEDVVPGVKRLRNQLDAVREAITGTLFNTAKTRSMLSHISTVLSGGLGVVGRDVRAKIKEILDGIDSDIKQRGGDVTKFRHVSTDRLVAGLGLSPEQARRVKNRLAQVGPNGSIPAVSSQFALAGGPSLTINGGVHLHGVQDINALDNQLTKRHKQRAHVRRGVRN